jgi:hypothetical protein
MTSRSSLSAPPGKEDHAVRKSLHCGRGGVQGAELKDRLKLMMLPGRKLKEQAGMNASG